MFKLHFTVDYEIFGNGSGNVRKCLIEPTERLLRVCESHGTRVTLFVDICEYSAFRKAEDQNGLLPEGYTPATWIEDQLRDAVRRGHDVQLHLHPQWIDHEYISTDRWRVNLDYWRLANVPGGYGNEEDPSSLIGLFSMGRRTLEDLLKPVKSDYECRAFRAGALCIHPEEAILRAMRACGLRYDSSVAPGMKKIVGRYHYDFTEAPNDLPYWAIENVIDRPAKTGHIFEIPIFTAGVNIGRRIRYLVERCWKGIDGHPTGCTAHTFKPGSQQSTLRSSDQLVKTRVKMFDFCRLAVNEMRYFIASARSRYQDRHLNGTWPIISIGHSKDFSGSQELSAFLEWIHRTKDVETDRLEEKSLWQFSQPQTSLNVYAYEKSV